MNREEAAFRRGDLTDPVRRAVFADWLEDRGRGAEAAEMRQRPQTGSVPRWRLGHRYSGYSGYSGSGGAGGDGGDGGSGGDGG